MTESVLEIIKELAKLSVPIIILYLKLYFDAKKSRSLEKKNTDYRIDIFSRLDTKVDAIQRDLKMHIHKDDNDNKIRQAILDKSFDIISVNSDLSQRIKFLLIAGQRSLISFAIEYYNSTYRTNENDKKDFLKIITDSINDKLKSVALGQFTHIKDIRGEPLDFVEFIKQNTEIYVAIKLFIQTLAKNGLSHSEYILVCEDFLKDVFIEGIKGWRAWSKIKEIKI